MKRKQVEVEQAESESEGESETQVKEDEAEEEAEEIDEDGNVIRRRAIERPKFIRGDDGYVSGSITRISLYNFMTYERCTIRPGPSLNMIIGPNGTGKSTISSAILIGLGFPPSFLGRSNKGTTGFIRLGQPFSEVEIELRAKDGKSSLTIFRKFGADKLHNEFRINGEVSTKQKVVEIVAELGIVANLCNYLPQDKVASFAAMAPPQLLQETMGAAGNPNLLKWHAELVNKGKEYDALCDELEQLVADRDKEQATVDQLRPEKEQYEARQALELRLRICKTRRNWVQYNALREAYKSKRRELRDATNRLNQVREGNAPLQRLVEDLSDRSKTVAGQLDAAEQAGRKLQAKMAECRKKIDEKDAATEGAQNSLNNLKRAAKEYKGRIIKEEVKLEQALAAKKPEVDPTLEAQEKAKRSDLNGKMRDLQQQQSQLKLSEKSNQEKADQISRELTDLGTKIAAANNVRRQREVTLCREDPSIAYTIKWLAEHRDEFEHDVLLPPAISVDVTDPRYAAQVEALMSFNATRTFVCQSQRDFARLDKLLGTPLDGGQGGQRGKVRINMSYQDPQQAQVQQPPLTEEEMQASGLDGYAADFVTGPEPLLRFLDQSAGLRRKGVSLRGEREIKDVLAQKLVAYATKDTRTSMHFSHYGGGTMSDSSSLGRPKYFTHVVDKDQVKDIETKIQSGNDNRRQLEEDGKTLRQRQEAVQQKLQTVQEQINALADAAAERLKAVKEYTTAQNQIRASKDRIEQYRQKADIEAESANLKKKIAAGGKEKLAEIVKYNGLFAKNAECVHLIMRTGLELCQANINRDHAEQTFRGRHAESIELQGMIAKFQEEEKTKKDDAVKCYQSFESRRDELGDHAAQMHIEIAQDNENGMNQTEAAWDELVAEANAELQANTGFDPTVVKRFDKHFEMLTNHNARLQVVQRRQVKMRSGLDAVLNKFTPALDDLISVVNDKFSAAFEYFGCAGKVELNRTADDYASWGIHIYVRYRDSTPLELLTATRQSGGERALATISFLMSLTEMARVPFSLVDEINQGMDGRAERHVHNRLVKVTCDPEAGQYFLITPKLLTNLEYHPRMTVLNVFNGCFMGKGAPNAGNVKATLASYRKRFRLV